MSEGTFGDLLWTMLYDSDFDYANNGPLAAGTQTYYLGYMLDGGFESRPNQQLVRNPVYKADSAVPQGLDFKKIPVHLTPLSLKVLPIDLVPFYVMMGDVEENVGDPDYDVSLNVSGLTPSVIWHGEDNYLKANQAREYFDTRGIKQEVSIEDGFLTTVNEFLCQRQYDMNNDGVVRTAQQPLRRGGVSPLTRYIRRHPDLVCQWVLTGGNVDMTKEFFNFSYSIETNITADNEEDGNDYPASLQTHGEWILSEVIFDFLLKKGESQELADLRDNIDKTTGLAVGDKMQLKLPRLHANDYLIFEFPNCVLAEYITPVEQASTIKGPAYLRLIFDGHTQVNIQERQTDAAGSSNKLPLAAYELA